MSLREWIKKNYYNNSSFRFFIRPFKYVLDLIRFRLISDKKFIEKKFLKNFGYPLDLKDPQTLNEKIQWLKLYDRKSIYTLTTDKYLVKKIIKKKLGEEFVVPLVFETQNPNDLTLENMPDFPVIIKTNHYTGEKGFVIVKNKKEIEWNNVQQLMKRNLKKNNYYVSKEWQYKNIKPRIIVEKLLINDSQEILDDYKVHCFNGIAEIIQVDLDRGKNHKRNLYDRNWNLLPYLWRRENGREVSKPKKLGKLIHLAEKIAADFKYVRVDFYIVNNQIFFGEITLHHGGGFEKFIPEKWDLILGQKIQLSNEKKNKS